MVSIVYGDSYYTIHLCSPACQWQAGSARARSAPERCGRPHSRNERAAEIAEGHLGGTISPTLSLRVSFGNVRGRRRAVAPACALLRGGGHRPCGLAGIARQNPDAPASRRCSPGGGLPRPRACGPRVALRARIVADGIVRGVDPANAIALGATDRRVSRAPVAHTDCCGVPGRCGAFHGDPAPARGTTMALGCHNCERRV
jgi:hypothetical protein